MKSWFSFASVIMITTSALKFKVAWLISFWTATSSSKPVVGEAQIRAHPKEFSQSKVVLWKFQFFLALSCTCYQSDQQPLNSTVICNHHNQLVLISRKSPAQVALQSTTSNKYRLYIHILDWSKFAWETNFFRSMRHVDRTVHLDLKTQFDNFFS